MSQPTPTLVTFPPSLDCELARFLLGHYAQPYVEDRQTLVFSFFATWRRARTLHFPLLDGPPPVLDTVRKLIDRFDPPAAPGLRLLGDGSADRAAIEADWTTFNATLGGATAAFAYFHLLPHRAIMIRPLSDGTPPYEVAAVRIAYPLFAALLRFLLKLSPQSAEAALAQIRSVAATVDGRLADGRRYLVGDRFSLSDMAFANALGPLVLPAEYGAPLPTFAEMPPALQAVVTEMRARPSGQFALRIYREHRRSSAVAPSPGRGHAPAIAASGQ